MKSHGIVAIIKRGNKYLLLKESRDLMFGYWRPPCGRMEKTDLNEEATVVREVMEETNLKVKPRGKLWTTKADTKVQTITFWSAKIIGGDLKIDKRESSDFKWVTPDEALKLELFPGTKKFFEKVKLEKIKI
jgi:8-oxo-dGTP pyrophosphatase MutT (NUDIX family)